MDAEAFSGEIGVGVGFSEKAVLDEDHSAVELLGEPPGDGVVG